MKERELGNMQIAGERIVVFENNVAPGSLVAYSRNTAPLYQSLALSRCLVVTEWTAILSEESGAASAILIETADDKDAVVFDVFVAESHRRLGLGRFMIRLATDQAIRYRKRTILAEVENTNAGALKILDEEDFEIQPEQHPGYTLLKKSLDWK